MLIWLFMAALALSESGPGASGAMREGDAHFARRAQASADGVAKPHEIDAAAAAYRRALALAPEALAARTALLRAIFFRGTFCNATRPEQRVLFDEARGVSEDGIARLEKPLGSLSDEKRLLALRGVPDAAALYFWAGVSWGQWSLARGKLAAARQGAATRIRDLAKTVIALDPELEQGGGYFLLGRLHDQAPWIPLLTGWVSHRDSIVYLRKALAIGPQNSVTQYFLAEAILHHDPSQTAEARRLLELCARSAPRPDYLVEDAHYAAYSRRRLAELER